MKTDHPICRDHSRADDPPGGRWAELIPWSRDAFRCSPWRVWPGRLRLSSKNGSGCGTLNPALEWSDLAVLARTRESLAPIRALCEHHGIPVTWGIDQKRSPALHSPSRNRLLPGPPEDSPGNVPPRLGTAEPSAGNSRKPNRKSLDGGSLQELLSAWEAETADAELPVSTVIEWIYESLAESRREHRLGQGMLLSTIHGAKGMEYPHVFILDGDWKIKPSEKPREEERRLLYVAMTRARETLSIFHRPHAPNPYLNFLQGEFLIWRRVEQAGGATARDPEAALPAAGNEGHRPGICRQETFRTPDPPASRRPASRA